VNQRRSSFVIVSITVHAIVLSTVVAASMLAPGLLPEPRTLLKWEPTRVVHPVDIPLPSPVRTRRAEQAGAPPTSARPPNEDPAPVVQPTGITAERGRESIASSTVSSVNALEHGGGSVDGVGMADSIPVVPPATTSNGPVRLHQGIQAPRKTVDVAPRYPMLARESRVEGIVILDVIIDERGNVTSTRVLKSVGLLDQAAIDAVRQWKFAPARLNGEAIPIVMTVTVSFQLH
jgi:periplasmic protein TonB